MARNITVTFDDGSTHVYQNAPDDITPDQVSQRAAKDFGKAVKALDGGRNSAPDMPPDEGDYRSRAEASSRRNLQAQPGKANAPGVSALNTYGVSPDLAAQAPKITGMDRAGEVVKNLSRGTGDILVGGAQLAANASPLAGMSQGVADAANKFASTREQNIAADRMAFARRDIANLIATPEFQQLAKDAPEQAQAQIDRLMPGANVARGIGSAIIPGAIGAKAAPAVNAAINVVNNPLARAGLRTLSAGAGGGLIGATTPVDTSQREYAPQAKENMAFGAGAGSLASVLGQGAGRMLNPNTNPNVAALIERGIYPTPGQTLGGVAKTVENVMAKVPIAGAAIRAGQQRAEGQLRTAVANDVLGHIGQQIPKGVDGREAVGFIEQSLGKAYDDVLQKVGPQRIDTSLLQDLKQAASPLSKIRPEYTEDFKRLINAEIFERAKANGGVLTGEGFKSIESNLGKWANELSRGDANARELGRAIGDAQQGIRDWLARKAPDSAGEIQNINRAYSKFKTVQNSSVRAKGEDGLAEGNWTANDLMGAVKKMDRSKDKGRFAKGEALLQDEIAGPAAAVLRQSTPSQFGSIGDLALLGGTMMNPQTAAVLAATSAYLPGVQSSLAKLLAQRSEPVRAVGRAITRNSATTIPAAAAGYREKQE